MQDAKVRNRNKQENFWCFIRLFLVHDSKALRHSKVDMMLVYTETQINHKEVFGSVQMSKIVFLLIPS